VEIVEVQELDLDGTIKWQEAGRRLHAGRWDDLRDRAGRRIAGKEIERAISGAMRVGRSANETECTGWGIAAGSVGSPLGVLREDRPERVSVGKC
jgi:hypothetical protein